MYLFKLCRMRVLYEKKYAAGVSRNTAGAGTAIDCSRPPLSPSHHLLCCCDQGYQWDLQTLSAASSLLCHTIWCPADCVPRVSVETIKHSAAGSLPVSRRLLITQLEPGVNLQPSLTTLLY